MKKSFGNIFTIALAVAMALGSASSSAGNGRGDATDPDRQIQDPTAYTSHVCPAGQLSQGTDRGASVCVPVTAGCQAGQVMTGLDNGQPTCITPNAGSAPCPSGQVIQSLSNGNAICTQVVQPDVSIGCPTGQVLQSISGGSPVCVVQSGGGGAGSLKFATGTGCGACPNGSFPYPGQGYACNVKDEQGNIRPPTGGTFWTCQSLQGQPQSFSFWTY